jgi:hypothetical protein
MAGTRATDGSSRTMKEHKQPQDRHRQQQQQEHPQVVLSSCSSSVVVVLSEGQRNQLAAIRDLWRGTTMVMHGGAWTGEAREPQRKEQLLEQLKVARQLRESLETAALQAERVATTTEQVRTMIVQQTPIMNTLVSLTEAVRGNYTLWRDTPEEVEEEGTNTTLPNSITSTAYHGEYNDWVQEDRRQRQHKLESAKAILRDQLQRLADPTRSWPKRTTVVLPTTKPPNNHSRDKSSKHPTSSGAALTSSKKRSKQDVKDSDDEEEEEEDNDRKPAAKSSSSDRSSKEKSSRSKRRDRKRDRSSSSRQDQWKKRRRHNDEDDDNDWQDGRDEEPRPDMALSFETSPSAHAASRNTYKHRPDDDSIRPDGVASSDVSNYPSKKQQHHQPSHQERHERPKAAPLKPAPTSYKYKPMPAPKRCHNCKSYKTKFLKCQYMLPTGNKCGKYYCSECLEREYEQLPAVTHQLLESTDWQYVYRCF